jgi:hypothetical protein
MFKGKSIYLLTRQVCWLYKTGHHLGGGMRVPRAFVFLSIFALSLLASAAAQQTASTSSPQAIQLLQRALLALTSGPLPADISLTGTVRRIAGSDDETGQATLTATPTDSRVDFNLPSGKRSEVHRIAALAGSWSDSDGVSHQLPFHNVLTEPAWFFPSFAIGRGLSASGHLAAYIGQETKDSQTVEHLSISQQSADSGNVPALVQRLSQTDLYLDSTTLLPVALTFNIHPDNNAVLDVPIEIRFSDYRSINGIQVPFHVQKFLNNSLILDLQFSTATLNTGFSAS